MPAIISVSRFKITRDEAIKNVRDAVPLLKKQGASDVELAFCQSGQFTGQCVVVVRYADAAAYGRALDAQQSDNAFQQLLSRVQQIGTLEDRSVFIEQQI